MMHIRPMAAALACAALCLASLSSCGAGAPKEPEERRAGPVRIPSIGLVFNVGDRYDSSFNRSAYDGLSLLARDVGGFIRDDPDADYGYMLDIRVLESKLGGADREQLLRSLAEEGRDLVIAVGFLFADSIGSVSRDFPSTHFVLIDGAVPDLDSSSSITCVEFAEQEGSFLVGAYAGMIARAVGPDARIGFVGGMDAPLSRRYLSGYIAGAAYVNPTLRATGRVVFAFVSRDASGYADPKRAGELASVLYQAKSAVIFQAAGASGRGVFEAATRLGTKAIGSDSDQAAILASSGQQSDALLSKVIVASMVKRVDRAVYSLGRELLSGAPIAGGYRNFGLSDGGVGYVAPGLPPEAVTVLADLSRRIVAGEIAVPADEQALADFIAGLR